MRMEYILIALLFVAAFFGSRKATPEKKHDPEAEARALQQAKDAEDKRYFREYFIESYIGILSGIIRYQGYARTDAHCAWVTRHLSESCIRFIEEQLADQDEHGITFSSVAESTLRSQELEEREKDFIRFQQGVHAHVEKARDFIFQLQKLAEEVQTWMKDKAPEQAESAAKLVKRIEEQANTRWKAMDEMLVTADKDPVGSRDAIVTPKVTEFRNMLVELRSKIRTDLAAKAKSNS